MRFRIICLLAVLSTPSAGLADVASIYDYRLGDHIIDYPLSGLDVISHDLNGFGGQAFIKLNGVGTTEVSLTFRLPNRTLQYIEHYWTDAEVPASTSLGLPEISEFTFGQSRVVDVQAAFKDQGFHYSCRQLQLIPEGILTFVSFEIEERPNAVYTFVFEYSRDLAERGLLDDDQVDLTKAILVATIVARPNYAEDFWCSDIVAYTAAPEGIPRTTHEAFDFIYTASAMVQTEPWAVVTEPFLMVTKHGAITWGDRLHIVVDPQTCSHGEFMIWAHTYDDEALLALEGQEVAASLNVVGSNRERASLRSPLVLDDAMFAPIDGRNWPPFAVGRFWIGNFDLNIVAGAENDPAVLGFSLEFQGDVAGMRSNFWTLEGLEEAASQAMRICREIEG